MNYSTLKKTVVLSCVSLMAVGFASAQMADTSKSTKSVKTMKMSDTSSTAKLFGGAGQYNTFSVGINVGVTAPFVATGGVGVFTHNHAELGYGVSLRDQLSHAFSLQLDYHGGKVSGNNGTGAPAQDQNGGGIYTSFSTKYNSGTLSGIINVGSVSFLHRQNSVNFFVSGGAGMIFYKPSFVGANGQTYTYTNDATNIASSSNPAKTIKALVVPVGAGVKFKLTDQLDLNFGYTENFLDAFNFEGVHSKYPAESKYSYGYGGLEYTFGPKSKKSLEWVNPIATMYDELYDAALRQEVEALKGRVTNVENAVSDLKKDSDGDGVSDQFDKCPNTPAGTVVDGSGCPIVMPKLDTAAFCKACQGTAANAAAYSNIQFEFDSSVLKTSSYPVLDATSADLRAKGGSLTLAGYASSEGTAAHNMRLSRDRANSVKTYLVNSGVDAKRLKIKAYGETHPIADNSTEEGRIANRRVEFHK